MGRLIVLIVAVVVLVWLVRRAMAGRRPKDPPRGGAMTPGELVRCARCGLHVPRADARSADGALYCSDEHARLGRGDS
jgi:uncharacterized protein